MQAVVLAAGEGTRLRPLTDDTPKGLVEVAGRPILTHCFTRLAALSIDEIVVVVGYRADQIIDHYGRTFGEIPLTFVQQPERRGVADALLAASDHVSGTFALMHGDYLFGVELAELIDRHRRRRPAGTLLVETLPDDQAVGYGVCEFDGEGELVGLVEKPETPPSNVVITGFFVFEPPIFDACRRIQPSDRGEYELADAIDALVEAGYNIDLVHADGWLVNVNTTEDLERGEWYCSEGEARGG